MMKLTKNIRISLYILIPIVLWMASGLFKNDKVIEVEEKSDLFSVQTVLSSAIEYQPLIKLKATTKSEARVDVKAKTSGEVVKIGATQGKFLKDGDILKTTIEGIGTLENKCVKINNHSNTDYLPEFLKARMPKDDK